MWRRRRNPEAAEGAQRARQFRIRAERDLAARRADTPRIQAMTDSWRHIRERNNFAAALEQSFRGGKA